MSLTLFEFNSFLNISGLQVFGSWTKHRSPLTEMEHSTGLSPFFRILEGLHWNETANVLIVVSHFSQKKQG